MRTKETNLREDNRFLSDKIKTAKRQNKLLKFALVKTQQETEEQLLF